MTAIILLGPPGVGKGTQANIICEKLGIPAISTGQIFRQNIAENTELGQQAQEYMNRGEFVPDSVTNPMVEARLTAPDTEAGFLLDGYPRNLDQVHVLRDMLAKHGKKIDVVLELTAPDEVLTARMMKRAQEEHRSDDTPEVFQRRVEIYHEHTEPIATYYADQDLLVQVSSEGSVEEVTQAILDVLSNLGA